jgi:diguanylate cyclase (GGDEF)-like protein/PAS domain S-box-containing protein
MGICDVKGQIVDVNRAMADMLGYTIDELRQINVQHFAHPMDAPDTWVSFAMIARGERSHSRREKYFQRKDGRVVCTDMTTSLLRDEGGRPALMVSIMQDITEKQLLHAELEHQARHDPLTGLPNRRLVFERMAELFAADSPHQRVGLCYVDLDGFKVVNDALGHDIGDRLLVAVGGRIQQCVKRFGHMVGRMGGDEFLVVVARSTGVDEALGVADALLEAFDEPFPIEGHELSISASVGVVERLTEGATIADLVKAADTTLSWAKAAGKRRRSLFDAERHAREMARYTLAAAMPGALRRGEFTVEYQPLVRLSDAGICGVEALVRWRHPEFGLLLPSRFIDMAEETGLIVPLGLWVLEEACRQARNWQSGPDGLLLSVNMAVRQIQDSALVGAARSILRETGLDPSLLQLELTESALMTAAGEPQENLTALSAMGVRIAIDDFGTGYSNLAYLCTLPVHTLKLAQSFVDGLDGTDGPDPAKERVVSALIRLAHGLGLSTTAEGVETKVQADRLRELDCDTAQGWLFGRPGPATEIAALAR